jgi:exopolysaccharide biosynthesis polyprenyl glycosylphosphotransferase
MLKERDLVIRRVLISCDAFVISLAFALTFLLRKHFSAIYEFDLIHFIKVVEPADLNISDYFVVYIFLLLLWGIILFLNGMYRSMHIKSLAEVTLTILKSIFWVTLSFSVIVFLVKLHFISRLFFVTFMAITSVFLMLEKTIIFSAIHRHLKKGYNHRRLLIVGTGGRARNVIETITAHPEWGYDIVKVVDYALCLLLDGKRIKDCEVMQSEEDLRRILIQHHIDQVLFVVPRSGLQIIENFIYTCEDVGVDTAIAADFFNIKMSQLRHTDLDGIPLITFEKRFDKEWQLFVKRSIDVIVSGLGIIFLSPLFLVLIVLIKLTSPGSAFFIQERVCLRGRKFSMYKFRSMYQEAEKELEKLRSLNEVEGPIFKIKNDPRITLIGKLLRKFSIDELPQLFNVFFGRMSLVGPRPALPKEVEQYSASERRRLSVRPGITCLWQAYHRGEKDFRKWMQSDLDYVDNWSLALDFRILARTIFVVLVGKGAY